MNLKSIHFYFKKHLAFIFIVIVAILAMEYLGFFLGMSNYCYDLFFRLRGNVPPEKSIVLVAVDEKTLTNLGRWPLRRVYYAGLLDRLNQASIVGLDIILLEPSADDAILAAAVSRHGRVVFPEYIAKHAQAVYSSALLSPLGTGHIHLEQDIDGIVRSVYHTLYKDGKKLPSFTSAIYEKMPGKSFVRKESIFRGDKPGTIIQRDLQKINFYGPQGTFPCLSLTDVIDGKYGTDFFRDKIVMVGVTAEGLEAGVLTPFGQQRHHMSGVETHAHILGNLIDGRRIIDVPNVVVWFLSIGISFLCFLLLLKFKGWRVIFLWLSGITAVIAVSLVLFAFGNIWFSPIPFVLLFLFEFFLAYIFRLEEAGKQLTKAEELWEDSFNSIDDAIIVLDSNGIVLQRNEAAAKMQKHDQRLMAMIKNKFPINVLNSAAETKQNTQKNKAEPIKDEVVDAENDRHFAVKTLPRYDCTGRLIGFVQVIQDITEQKRAAREKQRLEAGLIQAQKMEAIGTLAGGVAHDFNNILMGIQGYVSLMQLDLNSQDRHFDQLQKIESQVQSAANLTRQLLGFARGGKYNVQPTNVNDLVEKTSDVFGRTKKEVAISIRYEENLLPVMADRGQLEQVLLNIYINGWQAMPEGGELYLETKNVILNNDDAALYCVNPGEYVQISVTDTGTGMDEATRKRIFEPFFTTKEPGKGTGLGLASAYGIIKNHGGFIDVISQEGKGSTFQIYLPVTEEYKTEVRDVSEKTMHRGKETILVVDDEPMNVMLLKELLEHLGYKVLGAGSGQEALALYLVKKELIDLVILDMIMPGMGGGAAFDALRSINPALKIILSSGYSIEGDARNILDRGCNGFIQKPFLMSDLSRKIRDVL